MNGGAAERRTQRMAFSTYLGPVAFERIAGDSLKITKSDHAKGGRPETASAPREEDL